MKAGIYLGPQRPRTRRLAGMLLVAFVVGTLVHAAFYVLDARELDAIRAEIEQRSGVAGASSALDDDAQAVLARLRAASVSGASTSLSASELLYLVAGALPDDVALAGLSLEPTSSRPSLLIDAIARREQDVTTLERSIAATERVVSTRLLGERRGPDGTLSIRLQVDLRP